MPQNINESFVIEKTARATPWLAVTVAALGYFVDLYDLVIFSVVRVASLGSDGLGLLPADPTRSVTGWQRIGHLFQGPLDLRRGISRVRAWPF